MNNPFSLEGKTILITGASSGIGKGIAIECSKMGAKVILHGRNEDRLDSTLSKLEGKGHFKVSSDIFTQEGIDYLASHLPVLDGCVFCAGIAQVCTVKHFRRIDIENIFRINTFSPMMITSLLLKKKLLSSHSSLVYIESISGIFVGTKADVSYQSTKGALNGFLKGLALELAPLKIRVNAINPGLVPTDILNISNTKFGEEHHIDIMLDKYPLKRFGKPEDIAYGVIYLLSDASSWTTGINLVIDGGYIIN